MDDADRRKLVERLEAEAAACAMERARIAAMQTAISNMVSVAALAAARGIIPLGL
jgi:hypothetical protein